MKKIKGVKINKNMISIFMLFIVSLSTMLLIIIPGRYTFERLQLTIYDEEWEGKFLNHTEILLSVNLIDNYTYYSYNIEYLNDNATQIVQCFVEEMVFINQCKMVWITDKFDFSHTINVGFDVNEVEDFIFDLDNVFINNSTISVNITFSFLDNDFLYSQRS